MNAQIDIIHMINISNLEKGLFLFNEFSDKLLNVRHFVLRSFLRVAPVLLPAVLPLKALQHWAHLVYDNNKKLKNVYN